MAQFKFDVGSGDNKMWPRATEQPRVNAYRTFDRLYEGQHQSLESENRMPIHWFRRVSEVWAEMLFASPPRLAYDGGGRVSEWLRSVEATLMAVAYDCAVDLSRYGTGLMRVEAHRGQLLFAVERPAYFLPVVDPRNIEYRRGHYFGYPYNPNPVGAGEMPTRLRLVEENYESGEVRIADYDYDGATIGNRLSTELSASGVAYPRVVQVPNGRSENGWGESDYVAMAPLIAEMEQRLQGVSSVLDRHTDPHLAVPEGSVSVDESGNADLNAGGGGSVFPVGEGEVPPAYVVWEARLEAAFEQVQWAQDLLFAMTGLSAAMFSGRKNLGTIESGVALRSRYLATHLKLEGLRRRFETGFRDLLLAASRETFRSPDLEAVPFDPMALRFEWEDIFPADDGTMGRGEERGSAETEMGAAR